MAYSQLSHAWVYGDASGCIVCGTAAPRRHVVAGGYEPVIVWSCSYDHAREYYLGIGR